MGKVKEFWTKNKDLIIGAACFAVGVGTIGWVVGSIRKVNTDTPSDLAKFLCSPESGLVGELCQVSVVSNRYSWWRRDMSDVTYTIADLGKAGEDLVGLSDGRVTPDTDVTGILLYHM